MDARPKTVSDILHTGDQYIIPFFQRYYSWKKEHWDRLKKDIWALMEDDAKMVHFLGPLVCTPTSHYPGGIPAYQLIDGQQRLTTLTVLLAALRDVALSRNEKDLAAEISEDYLLHKRKQGTERYKVLPRLGDREALIAILEGHEDLTAHEESGVLQAWKYFKRHTEHLARMDTVMQLKRLFDTVTRRLSLVVVTIEGENPYEIFESLNSTGLPLEESDLIRNFIFMQVPIDKQQDFHERHWKPLEGLFEAREGLKELPMTPFFRDYLMRNGRYSREDSTFVDFKQQQKDSKLSLEDQVKELIHFAKLDVMLRRPQTVQREPLRRLLTQVDGMDISTAYPLILNLLDRNARTLLSDEDLEGCLLDLVSFVLRRSIGGETTRQYGKWFVEAITVIKDTPRVELAQYWLRRKWPDDQTVQSRVIDFPIYWRESRKTRIVLEAIEESYDHKEKVSLKDLTIEHVMPQTIGNNAAGKSWKAMLGEQWEKVSDKCLHTLGNLTLTGYNPDLSNSSYEKKRELLAESHLELNKYFAPLPVWTAETIKDRSRQLAEILIRLWPRPQSGETYKPSAEALPDPEGLSVGEKKRLAYRRSLDSRLEDRGVSPELIVPNTSSCLEVPIGKTGSLEIQIGFWPGVRMLYISLVPVGDVGEAIEEKLKMQKDSIENVLGYKLEWQDADIFVADRGVAVWDREDWPVQHDWLGDRLEDFLRVFNPLVEQLEDEVLKDPAIRQKYDLRKLFVDYWTKCAAAFDGSPLKFMAGDTDRGKTYCRFDSMDDGVALGVSLTRKHMQVGVYFKVDKDAPRSLRNAFKTALEQSRAEMRAVIGPELEWEDPYLSMYMGIPSLEDYGDWPRQFAWLRDKAEKMYKDLRIRLNLGA